MPLAKLQDHLRSITERLEAVTVALLSEHSAAHTTLMAERRDLLADVERTCGILDRRTVKQPPGTTLPFQQSLRLIK